MACGRLYLGSHLVPGLPVCPRPFAGFLSFSPTTKQFFVHEWVTKMIKYFLLADQDARQGVAEPARGLTVSGQFCASLPFTLERLLDSLATRSPQGRNGATAEQQLKTALSAACAAVSPPSSFTSASSLAYLRTQNLQQGARRKVHGVLNLLDLRQLAGTRLESGTERTPPPPQLNCAGRHPLRRPHLRPLP